MLPAESAMILVWQFAATDLLPIELWCREWVPEHLWPRVRVEADVEPRHVTIVEVRAPWDGVGDRTRFPIARLRYTATTGP
jgi:hypothetical protein